MRKLALPRIATKAPRWLRRLALAWAGWLLLGTVLLNQPLMDDWVSPKPEKLRVQWDFALSLLPGHVIAWGVDLRGQVRGTAFGAHARRGSGWWVPWSLVRKQIRMSGVSASGLAVALRRGSVRLPPPAARERPWTLVLSGAEFTELWSLGLGSDVLLSGRASGGLDLRKVLSGGEIEVANGRVDWQDLQLRAAGMALAEGGRLQATLAVAPLRISGSTAIEKLAALDLDLSLQAGLVPLMLDKQGLHVDPQAERRGQVEARLLVAEGVLADGTSLSLREPMRVAFKGLRDDRDLDLGLAVRDRRLVLDATLPKGPQPATTLAAHLDLPLPTAGQLQEARKDGAAGSLVRLLLEQANGSMDLSLRFRGLKILKPWLAKWQGLQADGEGWMHAQLRLDQGRLVEGSTVRFQDARLNASAMDHHLEARIDGPLVRVDPDSGRHRLELQQVKLFGPDRQLLLQDAGAQLDLVPHRSRDDLLHLPGLALQIEEAAIPDIAVFNTYLPTGAVELGKGAASLWLTMALDAADASAHGELRLRAPAVQVNLGDMRLQGQLRLDAALRDADFERKTMDLSGTRLALREVSFHGPGDKPVSGWSMDATLDSAQTQVTAPLRIRGSGRVAMSDLRLLLSVYSRISDYPLWILRLADAGHVSAKGRFALGDGRFVLEGVHASNERFAVDAGLTLGKQLRRGALLASWGPLAVAVELGGGGAEMHIANARDWYREQARQVPPR